MVNLLTIRISILENVLQAKSPTSMYNYQTKGFRTCQNTRCYRRHCATKISIASIGLKRYYQHLHTSIHCNSIAQGVSTTKRAESLGFFSIKRSRSNGGILPKTKQWLHEESYLPEISIKKQALKFIGGKVLPKNI